MNSKYVTKGNSIRHASNGQRVGYVQHIKPVTDSRTVAGDYASQSDAVRQWISEGIRIPVNIHRLAGDEYGVVASNRPPIKLGNSRNSFHEGWGRFEGEALQDLAQITGIPQKAFTVVFRG